MMNQNYFSLPKVWQPYRVLEIEITPTNRHVRRIVIKI